MARAVKKDILVKYVIDSREKDISYTKDLLDQRISKDGIKFVEIETKAVKPNGCKVSTGDITIEIKAKDDENSEWKETTFCLELKKKNDIFGSLYTADSRNRLFAEIDRCKEYGLELYFICTDDFGDINKIIQKIPKFRNSNVHNTHFENVMKLQEKLLYSGYQGILTSGSDLAWLIRRLAKYYIKKNKLQYKV